MRIEKPSDLSSLHESECLLESRGTRVRSRTPTRSTPLHFCLWPRASDSSLMLIDVDGWFFGKEVSLVPRCKYAFYSYDDDQIMLCALGFEKVFFVFNT